MIDVRFTVTKTEYMEAQRLFIRDRTRISKWLTWAICAVLSLGILIILLGKAFGAGTESLQPLAPAVVILVVLLLGSGYGSPLTRLTLEFRFRKEIINLTNMHVRIDETGYWCEVPGIGAGITNWAAYSKCLEGKQVFIFKSSYTFRVLPKRVLTKEEVQEVRALAQRVIAAPKA